MGSVLGNRGAAGRGGAAAAGAAAVAGPFSASAGAATPRPLPRVSVVVPTFHRPDLLQRCLQALLRQSIGAAAFEILVVDDGHSDATEQQVNAIAAGAPPGTLLYLRADAGRGPAVARNHGWRSARAPLIAFTDDDTIPDLHWLREGERAMADPAWVALAGRVVVPRAPGPPQPPTDHELMTRGLETAEFVTANAFVRSRALAQVRGFDERFKRAWREDSDLQYRLQDGVGPVGRCDAAVVLHPVRPERWGVSLRQQKNAYFDALLYCKHPQAYRQRLHPSPPWHYYGIVLLCVAAAALALAQRPAWAGVSAAAALLLVLRFALARLRPTSHAPAHVVEMLVTSALIPFLSVYWRLRGAAHFRVWFW